MGLRLLAIHGAPGYPQVGVDNPYRRVPASSIGSVAIEEFFSGHHGLATTQQLLAVMSEKMVASHVRSGTIVRVWHGVYALNAPDLLGRLAALDLIAGESMVACMNTAARLYDFDTEPDERIHVLDPGVRMRPSPRLMVHQRVGAPLKRIQGRLATAPAWTAVELARALRRPRALAVLDAALRGGYCTRDDLTAAIREQKADAESFLIRELVSTPTRAESPKSEGSCNVYPCPSCRRDRRPVRQAVAG